MPLPPTLVIHIINNCTILAASTTEPHLLDKPYKHMLHITTWITITRFNIATHPQSLSTLNNHTYYQDCTTTSTTYTKQPQKHCLFSKIVLTTSLTKPHRHVIHSHTSAHTPHIFNHILYHRTYYTHHTVIYSYFTSTHCIPIQPYTLHI